LEVVEETNHATMPLVRLSGSRTLHRHVGKARPHVVVPAAMVPHLIPPWRLSASEAGLMASSFWPAARWQSLCSRPTELTAA